MPRFNLFPATINLNQALLAGDREFVDRHKRPCSYAKSALFPLVFLGFQEVVWNRPMSSKPP